MPCICGNSKLELRFVECAEHIHTFGVCEDCRELIEVLRDGPGDEALGSFVLLVESWFELHQNCHIHFFPECAILESIPFVDIQKHKEERRET